SEIRIGEVLASEVAASEVVELQLDPGQIMGLVAGRGIELRERDSNCVARAEGRAANVGTSEICARQNRTFIKVCISEVRLTQIGVGQIGVIAIGASQISAFQKGHGQVPAI